MRAEPKTIRVETTPKRRSACAAFWHSSGNRSPRVESPSRNSWSSAATRQALEATCAAVEGAECVMASFRSANPFPRVRRF
jgi:hypothetical protein